MSISHAVESFTSELAQRIADGVGRPFFPTGGRTKSALAAPHSAVTTIDMTSHRGIVAYEPSEFLITARSGTTVGELQSELSQRGQYLPCDPLFMDASSTVGGTVAAGISGSSRLLYGSLRDFVMEVQFIDGLGQIVRGGGKVVKNAAGFDLPKLMVGSYGRLGILTELTLKVYPAPAGAATLLVPFANISDAVLALQQLTSKPLPLAALDIVPSAGSTEDAAISWLLAARFCAPIESLGAVAAKARTIVGSAKAELLGPVPFSPLRSASDDETAWWLNQAQFIESQQAGLLVRVAMGPADIPRLESVRCSKLANCDVRYTGAGSVAWLRCASSSERWELDRILQELKLAGAIIVSDQAHSEVGDPISYAIGDSSWKHFANRIRQAIDPNDQFMGF